MTFKASSSPEPWGLLHPNFEEPFFTQKGDNDSLIFV